MKLVKLSLAAVVAAGSFSFANAVALDEAIQNVDLSGMMRYRYDSETTKTTGDGLRSSKDRSDAQFHKFKTKLKFTADIADNFKATAVMEYSSKDRSYGKYKEKDDLGKVIKGTEHNSDADTGSGFKVKQGYLTYNNFDTTIDFGRMEIGSIWTDGLIGDGITVANTSIEGVTLAAYMFDTFDKNESDLIPDDDIYTHNLYGVAALVDYEPVNAGLWVSYLNKVGTFYAIDLGFAGGDKDSFEYKIHAQYAGNSLKGDFKKKHDDDVANGNFYAVEAGFGAAGFDFNLGYVGFGKKDKLTVHAMHDKGQLINAGEIIMDGYHGDVGKHDYIFGTIGYNYDDLRFAVDIVSGKLKAKILDADVKFKLFEVTPRLSYNYSKKLSFSSFYAYGQTKDDDFKIKTKKIRLEAKYKF